LDPSVYGQDNVVADALSRVESVTTSPSHNALAASQDNDDELRTLLASNTTLQLEKQQSPGTTVSIYCDASGGNLGLTFQLVYGSKCSRPSTICRTKATARLVAQHFMWPGIEKNCRTWARACQVCQRSKVFHHTGTPVGHFTLSATRFLRIHMDLVGPLPKSAGYTYCLIVVDRFTRWPEAIPFPNITADTVAHALLTGWISGFGCPQNITTDQGRQFESQLFQSIAKLCGIKLSRATAHHSAANELFHRTLKAAILCYADQQWTDALPLVLLSIRT
jgi:hypothetical protein